MLFACVLQSGNPSVHSSVTTCSGGFVFNKGSMAKSTRGLSSGLLLASIWQTVKANRSLKSSCCRCVKGSYLQPEGKVEFECGRHLIQETYAEQHFQLDSLVRSPQPGTAYTASPPRAASLNDAATMNS